MYSFTFSSFSKNNEPQVDKDENGNVTKKELFGVMVWHLFFSAYDSS